MQLEPKHIKAKEKKGKVGDEDVWHIETTGGLHMYVAANKGKVRTLGAGPHPGIARFIAEKQEPRLSSQELAKSERLDPIVMQEGLAFGYRLTAEFQRQER